LIGALPYAGSVYFVYESLKIYHKEKYKLQPNPFERIIYGALAGVVGQTASYPFDILRRRMQTANLINQNESNLNSIQLCTKIIREEGFFKGMYKGLSLNWIKGPIAAGIGFMTFDILQLFTRENFYYKK
jgi:solute carrier family 25, member 42